MKTWTEELLFTLSLAPDVPALFDRLQQSARRLGFDQCAYGLQQPVPFTNPKIFMVSNYDCRWRRRYLDAGYLHVDPTVRHARRSLKPMIWSDELFRETPEMWEEARSFGLRVGWAQSCVDVSGAVGLLSLSRSHERLTCAEIIAKEPYLRFFVSTAHIALVDALAGEFSTSGPALSAREIEILKWTGDGKTASETADILGIATSTVSFHVNNVLSKLRVPNKAAAVARAAALGLLG